LIVDSLVGDVRYACRLLVRTPAWTTVAIISLTLGIAANLLIFSIVDAVLLRPFPYRDPSQLVFLWGTKDDSVRRGISGPDLEDWRQQNRSFAGLDAFLEQWTFSVGETGQSVTGACIGPSVLPILGVSPALGRNFVGSDARPGAAAVAIVSHAFWRNWLGGRPDAVGSTLVLNGRAHEIVGVTAAGFFFPDTNSQILVPTPCGLSNYGDRGSPTVHAIGRLRAGVSVSQAEQDLDAVNRRLAQAYPETNKLVSVGLQPLRNIVIGKYVRALWVLLGAVGLVLLIACANVAHLQLARGVDREMEMAIRAAAGADRRRLFLQLLTESLLLAWGAGVCALATAWVGIRVIRSLALTDIARIDSARLDVRLVAFAVGLSLLVTLISGVWPAWKIAGVQVSDVLKLGGGSVTRSSRRHLSELLATTELALATVLLIVAGLFIGSFVRLSRAQWGFDPSGLLIVSLRTPPDAAAAREAFADWVETLRLRIRHVPGVDSVANADGLPIKFSWWPSQLAIDGRLVTTNWGAAGWIVSHGYFATMGTRLLEGREFTDGDGPSAEPVTVVSRALAQKLWPGQQALGRRFQILILRTVNGKLAPDIEARIRRRDRSLDSDMSAREIAEGKSWRVVGVVEDIRAFGLDLVPSPAFYLEYRQAPRGRSSMGWQYLVVRTRGDVSGLAQSLKTTISSVNSGVQIRNIEAMSDLVAQSIGGRGSTRLLMLVAALFGSLALLLTASGIFGVVLHTVNQRLPEIGVRIALGASQADITNLLLQYGLRIIAGGVALGLTLSWVASRGLGKLVFEVKPTDPSTWAVSVTVLVVSVLLACAIPIRRARQFDAARLFRA
jgi:putative ABC transport system permease protein